jgi:integrase
MSTTNGSLSQEEYRTLVEAAHQQSLRHSFTVYLIGHTGLGRTEAAEFAPDWFDPEQRRICVPGSQGNWSPKSEDRVREIPLSGKASAHISDCLAALDNNAFGVSPSTIYDRVTKSAEAANLESVSPHVLRTTYANRLLELGLPDREVARVLGIQSQTLVDNPDSYSARIASALEESDSWPLYGDLSVYDSVRQDE